MTKIKVGTFYTVCCCEDASIIENEKELAELLEDMKDDETPYYDFYDTAKELIKKCCSCDGECKNIERLRAIRPKPQGTIK